jgi:quinol-cytochrome oxidoreductase complex cytochrome b subunit/coenzyme F420-reducing hydrogenase delta subunit
VGSAAAALLDRVERPFDRAFPDGLNPWRHLGGLAYLLFWVVAATGIYVYIGFDTSADGAYASVERLTSNDFPLGSLARSLHRYASDAFVLVTVLHLVREWARGRYAHWRRFSWLTGVLALWLVFASGIGGFWLVWDQLAQYSLIATMEWLDALPFFDGALIRNFIAPDAVNDRFFSLLIFLHIGISLALLATMWVHVQRLAVPATSPPRALTLGTLAAIALLCLVRPVTSDAPAALALAPAVLRLDWFYLGVHAFADVFSPHALWIAVGGTTLLLLALPYLSRAARTARPPVAIVDPANCNGCGRCFADCPYAAVTMQPRRDGRPLPRQAVVDPDLCAACGICAGACPSSTPFRSVAELVSGIDLPQAPIDALRARLEGALARIGRENDALSVTSFGRTGESSVPLSKDAGFPPPTGAFGGRIAPERQARIVVFGCLPAQGGADLAPFDDACTATLPLLCAAQLPPSFVEYALRAGADGVLVAGCRAGNCAFRLGQRWVDERIAGIRAPRLRPHVPRSRVRLAWTGTDAGALATALDAFRADLRAALRTPSAPDAVAGPPPKRLAHDRPRN